MRGLQGKNVLVTGGSSGIGQAIAVGFAEHGANVAINYLTTPDEAAGTEKMVHDCLEHLRRSDVREVLVQGDVSKEDDVIRMVEQTVDELGSLDVLVNNAGIQISRPSHELSQEDFEKVLGVNLRGAFLCAREAIKRFLEAGNGGVIINVSSVHQDIPKPDYLGYSVSKGGMRNLTRTLALEYAGENIRVNGIGPAPRSHPSTAPGSTTRRRRSWSRATSRSGAREQPRDGGCHVLPRQRRRRLHHGTNHFRRRWPDALRGLPRALVVGVGLAVPPRARDEPLVDEREDLAVEVLGHQLRVDQPQERETLAQRDVGRGHLPDGHRQRR